MRTPNISENRDELLNDFNKVVTETQSLLDSMTSATSEKTAAAAQLCVRAMERRPLQACDS